jgi:pilus assembly protein CpaF
MSWVDLVAKVSPEQEAQIVELASKDLQGLPLSVIRDRQQIQSRAQVAVASAATRLGVVLQPNLQAALVRVVVARIGGLGILDELLPPARTDLSEISINPDGSIWILRKGERFFERYDRQISLDEAWRSVEALLSPIGRAISEAQPSVDAKLPRSQDIGGARVKIIHPILAPGRGYPSVNIRLFEPRPVTPEQIVSWDMCPKSVMDSLLKAVGAGLRMLIIGGTATGKTTFLSALAHGIPRDARIVKIEDPEEVFLPHKNIVTLEARPKVVGSDVPGYSLSDGVDDAMRMAPNWLIVGEVRSGAAALSLFRAQMSDHPGLSTLHAEGPEAAVHRLCVLLWADAQVRIEAAKEIFTMAVDLVVQVGWADGKRRVLGIWEVNPELKGGNVSFRRLYQPGNEHMEEFTRRRG